MAWPRMTTHATSHHFRVRRNPSREIGCHRLRSRRGNGIVERVPCCTCWPCSYGHPPRVPAIRASSSTFMRFTLPSAPPRFGPSPWAGIRWSRVPGQAVRRPGYMANALSEISLSPCQSRPRRPVMTPTPVVSSTSFFGQSLPRPGIQGPCCETPRTLYFMYFILLPSHSPLHTHVHRPPRPSAATCEHEQLSVMARQPPLLHSLALKSYPNRRSLSRIIFNPPQASSHGEGLTSLSGPKDQDGCDTVQFMGDQPAPDHVLPEYTRLAWVLQQ